MIVIVGRTYGVRDPVRREGRAYLIAALAFAVVTVLVPLVLSAQAPSILIGAGGRYEISAETGKVNVFAGSDACGVFSSGSGASTGFHLSLTLPSYIGPSTGFSFAIGHESEHRTLQSTPLDALFLEATDNGPDAIEEIDHVYRLDLTSNIVRLDFMLRQGLGRYFNAAIGISGGYRYGGTIEQRDSITDDTQRRFVGGALSELMSTGETLTPTSFNVGAVASFGARLPLSRMVAFAPEITLRADPISAVEEQSWGRFSAGFGASLLFDLSSRPADRVDTADIPPPSDPVSSQPLATPTRIDTPAVETVFRTSRFETAIDLYGIGPGEERLPAAIVGVDETMVRRIGADGEIVDDTIVSQVTPPLLGVDPIFDATEGIATWEIEMLHDTMVIGTFGSEIREETRKPIKWETATSDRHRSRSILEARLRVVDSGGSTSESVARLPLVIERRLRIVEEEIDDDGTTTAITSTLFPFEPESSRLDSANHSALLSLADELRSGVRVRVSAAGSARSTRREADVAKGRATVVANELKRIAKERGLRNVKVETTEEKIGLKQNEAPEGREVSRQVVVRIDR